MITVESRRLLEAVLRHIQKNLKREWEECLEQARTHEPVLMTVFEELGLNPDNITRGRAVVAHIGESLVAAVEMAKAHGSAAAAICPFAACRP